MLGGDCGRESTDNYNDGVGRAVRMSYPDHGYHTKDGRYVLFVDKNSCARRLDMISLRVYTIIGIKIRDHCPLNWVFDSLLYA